MEEYIKDLFYLIIILIEGAAVIYFIDLILQMVGTWFKFSWKKFFAGMGTMFGILWLKDRMKERSTNESKVNDLSDEDFEIVED